MTFVVDASVALKWVVDEPGSELAAQLLPRSMIAPALFEAEVGHVLTKRHRRDQSPIDQVRSGFHAIMSRVTLVPDRSLGAIALEHAIALRQSVYDCYYLALAQVSGLAVVTADAVLVGKLRAGGRGSLVRLLGDELEEA